MFGFYSYCHHHKDNNSVDDLALALPVVILGKWDCMGNSHLPARWNTVHEDGNERDPIENKWLAGAKCVEGKEDCVADLKGSLAEVEIENRG